MLSRKLLPYPFNDTKLICPPYCDRSNYLGYCQYECLGYCVEHCPSQLPPPPPPFYFEIPPVQSNNYLVTVVAVTFCLACFWCAYAMSHEEYRRRQQQEEHQRKEIQDEDHGSVTDNAGLQPSVITSITVCKYKSGEGLVEGTECSVCLNEFQEDETLSLFPNCWHAFHIACIDTWLRLHNNCPMCRAPIITNAAMPTPSSEAIPSSSITGHETQVGVEEIERESDDSETRSGDIELRNASIEEEGELDNQNARNRREDHEEVENGFRTLRRSVSLDSLSALKISQALVNVAPLECDRSSVLKRP